MIDKFLFINTNICISLLTRNVHNETFLPCFQCWSRIFDHLLVLKNKEKSSKVSKYKTTVINSEIINLATDLILSRNYLLKRLSIIFGFI